MSQPVSPQGGVPRPKRLLTQNRELKAIGVWNWSLPAWAGRLAEFSWLAKCSQARGTGLPVRGRRPGVRLFLLAGPSGEEQPRQPG